MGTGMMAVKNKYIIYGGENLDCSLLDNLEPLSASEEGLYEGEDYNLHALLKEWDSMKEELVRIGEFPGDGTWL
jgi:hypothetical protein